MSNVVTTPSVRLVTSPGSGLEPIDVYTVSQLSQHCAEVLDRINTAGRPAAVTRRGTFIAMITPLARQDVESVALSEGPLAEAYEGYAQGVLARRERLLSSDEVEQLIASDREDPR